MTFLHEDACEAPCTLCHRDDWRCDVLGIACREWAHRCPDCEALSPTRAVCNPKLRRATSGGPGVNGSLGCLDHVSTIRVGRLYEGELLGAEPVPTLTESDVRAALTEGDVRTALEQAELVSPSGVPR